MPRATGKGQKGTSHRQKSRTKDEWTGKSPVVRRYPLNKDHEPHINMIAGWWLRGNMSKIKAYLDMLRAEGWAPSIIASILSQGTQGMPGGERISAEAA